MMLNDGWTFGGVRTSTGGPMGRLELLFSHENGTSSWGSVCASGWNNKAAQVICRMFGLRYGRAMEPDPADSPPVNRYVHLLNILRPYVSTIKINDTKLH